MDFFRSGRYSFGAAFAGFAGFSVSFFVVSNAAFNVCVAWDFVLWASWKRSSDGIFLKPGRGGIDAR